jgi:hypothetical protein
MTSFARARILRLLAACTPVVLLPLAACFEDHVVGEDLKDSGTGKGDAGVASDAASCEQGPTQVCHLPNVGPGCVVGPATCVHGVYGCPAVTCPAVDAGACANEPICAEPAILPGCTVGPTECVNGVNQCPPVICPGPDAGTCQPSGVACAVAPIPSGCHLGPSTCPNGVYQCPAVICPSEDAGKSCVDITVQPSDLTCVRDSDCTTAETGLICSTDMCHCPTTAVNQVAAKRISSETPPIVNVCACVDIGVSSCIQGQCTFCGGPGQPACNTPGFACGTSGLKCDPATQFCHILEGGAVRPDGGTTISATCDAIPLQCEMGAGPDSTCTCLKAQSGGTLCSVKHRDQYTVTILAP